MRNMSYTAGLGASFKETSRGCLGISVPGMIHAKALEYHGTGERLDLQHDHAVLKDDDAAGGLADDDGDGLGHLADGCGGDMPRAPSLADPERVLRRRRVDVHARRLRHAVAPDHDRSFELSDVLDLLAHFLVAHVALFAA